MEVQIGINANCSEIVYQVCSINRDNVEEFKDKIKEVLKNKYAEGYLDTYIDNLCKIENGDYYCLGIADNTPDSDAADKASKDMGLFGLEYISCCSEYINTDEQMREHTEWKEKEKKDESTSS